MSGKNVAVVRSIYQNFANGNVASVLAAIAPQLEWVESSQEWLPHRGVHRSPQEVRDKVFAMVMERFDEFALIPELFHDAGDVVVVEGRAVGKTKAGGILDARAAWIWTVRDGLVTANHNYHDTDAWRLALTPASVP